MMLNFNLHKGYQERSSQAELNKKMITIATTDFSLLSMVKKKYSWMIMPSYLSIRKSIKYIRKNTFTSRTSMFYEATFWIKH